MNARYLDDDVTCVRQFGETTTKIGALQDHIASDCKCLYRDDCCHCFNTISNKFIKTICSFYSWYAAMPINIHQSIDLNWFWMCDWIFFLIITFLQPDNKKKRGPVHLYLNRHNNIEMYKISFIYIEGEYSKYILSIYPRIL